MKKNFLRPASWLLLILLTLACNSATDTSKEPAAETTVQGADTFHVAFNWDSIIQIDPIPFDMANKMFDNYRDNLKSKIENNGNGPGTHVPPKKQQTKYIWISYTRLKAFVDALGKYHPNPGTPPNPENLGLRIYLGTYLPDHNDQKVRRKVSVILCGTHKDAQGIHRDIASSDATKLLAITGYYNHGHLCPPDVCPGALLDEQ
jgi:hypothetical protein